MNTRRDFLRKLGIGVGVGAAGAAIAPLLLATPKVLATATSNGGTFTRTAQSPFGIPIVDAGGACLTPRHFRMLLSMIHQRFGQDFFPDRWIGSRGILRRFKREWMDGQAMIAGAKGSWDRDYREIRVAGILLLNDLWVGDSGRRDVLAYAPDGLLVGKIRNLGAA